MKKIMQRIKLMILAVIAISGYIYGYMLESDHKMEHHAGFYKAMWIDGERILIPYEDELRIIKND